MQVKKGAMSADAAAAALARVKGALDYNDFGKADMVIEAVIEDIGLKQRIFAGGSGHGTFYEDIKMCVLHN